MSGSSRVTRQQSRVNYAQADDTDDSVERQWKQLKSETDSDTIPDSHDGGRNRAVLLEVNSVAAAFEVKQELDPLHLAETLNNTEWKNASTLYVKIKEPKATAHVFKSGKVNLIGCQNEELARIAGRRVARMIQAGFIFVLIHLSPTKRVIFLNFSTALRLTFWRFLSSNLT